MIITDPDPTCNVIIYPDQAFISKMVSDPSVSGSATLVNTVKNSNFPYLFMNSKALLFVCLVTSKGGNYKEIIRLNIRCQCREQTMILQSADYG